MSLRFRPKSKITTTDKSDVVVLAGAGISLENPSHLPSADSIVQSIAKWIAGNNDNITKEILKSCSSQQKWNPFDFLRFEGLIQITSMVEPEILDALATLETHSLPNLNHFVLADIIHEGGTVLTTNFDTLIDFALRIKNYPEKVWVLSSRNRVPKKTSNYIKLHGTFQSKSKSSKIVSTLNQIGLYGLGFDFFSKLKLTLKKRLKEKVLVVIGYSASDSFDVVPLIEDFEDLKAIHWFEFNPDRKQLSTYEVIQGDSHPLPKHISHDFVGFTLIRIKGHNPKTKVFRHYGPSLKNFYKRILNGISQTEFKNIQHYLNVVNNKQKNIGQKNSKEFNNFLNKLSLSSSKRELLYKQILNNNSFGKHYTDITDEDVKNEAKDNLFQTILNLIHSRNSKGAKEFLKKELPKPRSKKEQQRYLEYGARIDWELGHIKEGYDKWERSIELSNLSENHDLYLMLHYEEFFQYNATNDIIGMKRVSRKIAKRARKGGHLWGLIFYHYSLAVYYHKISLQEKKFDFSTLNMYMNHSFKASYYALRSGREDWFFPCSRLYASALSSSNMRAEALDTLLRLDRWIADDKIKEKIVTHCSIVSAGILANQLNVSEKYLIKIRKTSEHLFPQKEPFLYLAEAEILKAKSKYKESLHKLEKVLSFYKSKMEEDTWGVLTKAEMLKIFLEKSLKRN